MSIRLRVDCLLPSADSLGSRAEYGDPVASPGMGHWGTCPPPLQFGARTKFSLYFGQENRIFLATTGVPWPKICRKCDSGRSSRRSPRPRSRLGSGHPSPYPPHLAPFGASMLAPSAPRSSCPSLTPNPGDATAVISVSVCLSVGSRVSQTGRHLTQYYKTVSLQCSRCVLVCLSAVSRAAGRCVVASRCCCCSLSVVDEMRRRRRRRRRTRMLYGHVLVVRRRQVAGEPAQLADMQFASALLVRVRQLHTV